MSAQVVAQPTPAEDAWERALIEFDAGMRRLGRSDTTIERVVNHLRAYSRTADASGPWNATAAAISRWSDSYGGGAATRSRASSARTFYRWAFSAGRIRTDPTTVTVRTVQPAAIRLGWHRPIQDWLTWLQAGGASHDVLRLRRHYLTRLANGTPAATPEELTGTDLVDWLGRHQWRRETARAARSSIRSFYRWALDHGTVSLDPTLKLPPLRTSSGMRRPASEDAYQRALTLAEPREHLMLRLACELGMRRAEIARTHAYDLTEDDGWWIEVHGKGEKTRVLPVPDDLAELIRSRTAGGWVFPGREGGHLSPAHVGVLLGRLLPDGVSAHALRHKFATDAYSATSNLLAVQLLMGHSSPNITQRYVKIPDGTLRATVAAARSRRQFG